MGKWRFIVSISLLGLDDLIVNFIRVLQESEEGRGVLSRRGLDVNAEISSAKEIRFEILDKLSDGKEMI